MDKPKTLSLKNILHLIKEKKQSFINLSTLPLDNFKGMYEEYSIIYNYDKNTYFLRYSLICYVLDFFGEYSQDIDYKFLSIEEIVKYVEYKLNKKLENMTRLDRSKIPTVFDITEEEKKEFQEIWLKCRKKFDKGHFLDKTLN
ncbi:MAG: hypothetical protein U0457_11265 [Candidatus Sericytochromatia bacterium]